MTASHLDTKFFRLYLEVTLTCPDPGPTRIIIKPHDILLYRGELARCADLLAFQLGKEKEYHNMLENICGNSSMLVGKAAEVGQKHGAHEATKQQMHQLLEEMFTGGKGALADSFGSLDEHRQLAEKHLMSSAELQNQNAAIAKELDNILQTLNVPPVSYREAPVMMGPSQMNGPTNAGPPRYGGMNGGMNGGMGGPMGGMNSSMNMSANPNGPGRFSPPNVPSNPGSPQYSPGGRSGPGTPTNFGGRRGPGQMA
ncbi:unnamed protein product [Effrenium voratum]|nr:unnamed protein product [Effrenium voratum]